MSRESAMRFLEACRLQPVMQREVGLLVDDARYDGLCAMAAGHDFEFTPAELAKLTRDAGARVTDTAGLSPGLRGWHVTRDLGVNYLIAAEV